MSTNNSSGDLYQQIYRKLLVVVPDLQSIEESGKSIVAGFMDLNLDVLKRGTDKTVIALSHYYRHPSGDSVADPDMEIAVYPSRGIAEALTYQDTIGYRVVYSQGGTMVDVRAKRDLNQFLNQWLDNLIQQGHCIPTQTEIPAYEAVVSATAASHVTH
jgi:uncharacterized protein YqiB (DUF1249 family)